MRKAETENDKRNGPRHVLDGLAHRLRRLSPDHRDPHRFHEEKSEIAFQLTQLARRFAQ